MRCQIKFILTSARFAVLTMFVICSASHVLAIPGDSSSTERMENPEGNTLPKISPLLQGTQPLSGTLCVTITPPEAVAASAQWRRMGTSAWRDSGSSETAIPAGNATVEFKSLPDWLSPATQMINVAGGQTTSITAAYRFPQVDISWEAYVPQCSEIHSLYVDQAGNIYASGSGGGSGWISGGYDTSEPGGSLAKISPAGRHLWSTFLDGGQSDENRCLSVAVDSQGNVYAAGTTRVAGWTSGGYNTGFKGGGTSNGYLVKMAPDGRHLWSTYIGGNKGETANGVALDRADNVYVTGMAATPGWISGGFRTQLTGLSDAYLVKFSPQGQHLWSTYMGGTGDDRGKSVVFDGEGNLCVVGSSDSSTWPYGQVSAAHGASDAFVTRMTPDGCHLWTTILGGGGDEDGNGIAVDGANNIYITGTTGSLGWTSGGYDTTQNGNTDAFVAKLNSAGQPLWSTYLGGAGIDIGMGIAADAAGNVFVTGSTESPGWVRDGLQENYKATRDAFVARLSPQGEHVWSTYLGTNNVPDSCFTYGNAIALERDGSLLVGGYTLYTRWVMQNISDQSWATGSAFLVRMRDLGGQERSGAMVVMISPPEAVAAGAQWRHRQELAWRDSATTATGLAAGDYGIEFKNLNLPGWTEPPRLTVRIRDGQTTVVTAEYMRHAGALCVTIKPPEAVAAGAQWRRVGTAAWLDSGTTETSVTAGLCKVEFKTPGGWIKYGELSLTINENKATTVTATFIRETGKLYVPFYPYQASSEGGRWRRVGTSTWYDRDAFESNIPTGAYTVEFKDIPGWTSPPRQAVTITANNTAYLSGCLYVRQTGTLRVSIVPPAAVAAGAQWRRVGTSTWRDSGTSETAIPTGKYQIEARVCGGGWAPPATQDTTVTFGQVTDAVLTYRPSSADLSWSTYMGGYNTSYGAGVYLADDWGNAVAFDKDGNIYVAGTTDSPGWVSGGFDTALAPREDAFVVKLSPTGRHLWSTYLGGSGWDGATGIAIDDAGNPYLTGYTSASGWVSGGYNTTFHGDYDGFVARLSPDGQHVWSTYLGGSFFDQGYAIALDHAGNVCVTGTTQSPGWTSGGADTILNSSPYYGYGFIRDAFVVKLSPAGQHLWSSYIGGSSDEYGYGIAVDAHDNIAVTGCTASTDWISGGNGNSLGGVADGFVAMFSANGQALWSSYLGGAMADQANDITFDGEGNIWVCGSTQSPGWISGGYNPLYQSGSIDEGFVCKLTALGQMLWGCYLGGTDVTYGNAIAVDHAGNGYVTGYTSAAGWISGDIDNILNNGLYTDDDAYVVKLSPGGRHLWSSYLGGSFDDDGRGIAVDDAGHIMVVGTTFSNDWISGGYDTTLDGGSDAFLALLHDNNRIPATTASLCVTLAPPEAVSVGAQWRRLGTTPWRDSGTTEAGIPEGACSVEFKPALGWLPPAVTTMTLAANQRLSIAAAYTHGAGLQVTLAPPEAVAAGAAWRRAGTTAWHDSGTSETSIPPGPCSVEFKPVSGWAAPASVPLTLSAGEITTLSAVYAKGASLCVYVNPASLAGLGARWRRVGTTAWRAFGTTENDLAAGVYDVECNTVNYWTRPANFPMTLTAGNLTVTTATYTAQIGSLKVTLTPPAAVTAGARWRRYGTPIWLASDATEKNLMAGPYTVEFKGISGWVTPSRQTLTVVDQQVTTGTAAYLPVGTLRVGIAPAEAGTVGAQWRRVGTTTWRNGSTSETAVSAGNQLVEFKPVANWITPTTQTVAIVQGQVCDTTGTYQATGGLFVTIAPPEAVAAGAKWRCTGAAAWNNSGTTVSGILCGRQVIEFAPLAGWTSPTTQTVTILNGRTVQASGAYTRQTGALCVTLAPPEAVAAGACWRRTGATNWLASGETEPGIPTGQYRVEFKPVTGWTQPASFPLMIQAGQWNTSATYARNGSLNVTLAPAEAVAAGAQWRRVGTADWCDSGTAEADVPAGSWQIEFKSAPGWAPPATQSISLAAGQAGQFSATYCAIAANLTWSTYMGITTDLSDASGVAVDGGGNLFVTGHNSGSAMVARISPAGQLLWSTNLGGNKDDAGIGIVLDHAGNVCVIGNTDSSGWISGGYDVMLGDGDDAFVAKLGPDGRHLWSTYLGGSFWDYSQGIAVDSANNIYAVGTTKSSGWVGGGANTVLNQGNGTAFNDAFVVKISPAGQLVWSSYVGGDQDDIGGGVAVDSQDYVYVAGSTASSAWVSGPGSPSPRGNSDVFVAKFTPAGQAVWSTLMGGSKADRAHAIAIDAAGDVCVAGFTQSLGWTSGGYQTVYSYNSNYALDGDGFIAKLSPAGLPLWSTYLGGRNLDNVTGLAVDPRGGIYVAGTSGSAGWCAGGHDVVLSGSQDAFAAKLSSSGRLQWSGYLGGDQTEAGGGIAVDGAGNVYVSGVTYSDGWVSGGFKTVLGSNGGYNDMFLVKMRQENGVRVTINSTVAVAAGAQWRVVGTQRWYSSGEAVYGLPPGSYTIEFRAISGWQTPANRTLMVEAGQLMETSMSYIDRRAAIQSELWQLY